MNGKQDYFQSLDELMSSVPACDYQIVSLNRQSPVTIIAPHGGLIEPGTSEIARRIAGDDLNLFAFYGLRAERAEELHVTSTRFRHPELGKLLAATGFAVSIHGMGKVDFQRIWLGGLNYELKAQLAIALESRGFSTTSDAPLYRGESSANVVNLPAHKGVQLEIPEDVIDEMLFKGDEKHRDQRLRQFATAVRATVIEYAAGLENERSSI